MSGTNHFGRFGEFVRGLMGRGTVNYCFWCYTRNSLLICNVQLLRGIALLSDNVGHKYRGRVCIIRQELVALQTKTTNMRTKALSYCVLGCLLITIISCSTESSRDVLLHHMAYIQQKGDSEPEDALKELGTIEPDVRNCSSDYVYYKYLLLRTRLHDKAYAMPSSSDTIEDVVRYFDEHGNDTERMESYYYQGSVYRDLKDYPRSIVSFVSVLEIAKASNIGPCVLLQNTYSQLSWLYFKQLLYADAYNAAKAGCAMAEETHTVDAIYLMDVATTAFSYSDTTEAVQYCNRAPEYLKSDSACFYPDVACELLKSYSVCKIEPQAAECFALINKHPDSREVHNYLNNVAYYLDSQSLEDSAIIYYKRVLEESQNFSQKKTAAHKLMDYYRDRHLYEISSVYAMMYALYVDSLFAESRYEQTSRACGEHLYAISLEKEIKARRETESYKMRVYGIVALFLLSALAASVIYGQKKRRFIGALLEKDQELGSAKDAIRQYGERLADSLRVVDEQKQKLAAVASELQALQEETETKMAEKELVISQQNEGIRALNNTIAENEAILQERQKQIKELVRLSLQEKASIDAAAVLQKFRDASSGKTKVDNADWKNLYLAVEAMYPGFRESVIAIPRCSEKVVQTAYLLKTGFNNPQIANLTDCSRTTVWDRVNRIKECLGGLLNPKTLLADDGCRLPLQVP